MKFSSWAGITTERISNMKKAGLWFVQVSQGYGAERLSGDQSPSILEYHIMRLKPDLYFTLNDPFYIGSSVVSTNKMQIPYVAYMPIDGYPISMLGKMFSRCFTHHYGWQITANRYSLTSLMTTIVVGRLLRRYESPC